MLDSIAIKQIPIKIQAIVIYLFKQFVNIVDESI